MSHFSATTSRGHCSHIHLPRSWVTITWLWPEHRAVPLGGHPITLLDDPSLDSAHVIPRAPVPGNPMGGLVAPTKADEAQCLPTDACGT